MRSGVTTVLAALGVLALAACGGGSSVDADTDGDGTVSDEEMQAASKSLGDELKPQPGLYATTFRLAKIEAPGAPDELKRMMGGMMDRTDEFCLTPEMAERGFAESLKEGQSDGCTINSFTIDNGDVDMRMACADEGGAEAMTIAMTGKVSPTSSDLTMEMDGKIPEMGPVLMVMDFEQERIGECKE